jgi:transcriptional regulator with XRE-family HTH domain
MGIVVDLHEHARATSGHKSGRKSPRETPVSRSIGNTNSAGTPRLDLMSQYQTWDCVVPMRSAKDFCPPANTQARLSASVDMHAPYPVLGRLQPKNMCGTTNRNFGTVPFMKDDIDPIAFGERLRQRRIELGLSQGAVGRYSQSNIGWLEKGNAKDPRIQALDLAGPLRTTAEWLLFAKGPKESGPPMMSPDEAKDAYSSLSPEDREAITAAIAEIIEANREKRKVR